MKMYLVGVPVLAAAPPITCTDLQEQASSGDSAGLWGDHFLIVVRSSKPVAAIARDLSVSYETLWEWIKQAALDAGELGLPQLVCDTLVKLET